MDTLIDSVVGRNLANSIDLHIVTDVSLANLVQGATDVGALIRLKEAIPSARITYLPRIHAKVYVANNRLALVTSANFTEGGARFNLEYGVGIRDRSAVSIIVNDVRQYASLGADIAASGLYQLRERTAQLREVVREEQRSVRKKIREAAQTLHRETEDDLIRLRVRDRSANAIFSDTILYLLARRPLTTEEMNAEITLIHPDLCDDTVDRIIDGKHYGKLWKHGVRGAQVTLRRQGKVDYSKSDRLWRIIAE